MTEYKKDQVVGEVVNEDVEMYRRWWNEERKRNLELEAELQKYHGDKPSLSTFHEKGIKGHTISLSEGRIVVTEEKAHAGGGTTHTFIPSPEYLAQCARAVFGVLKEDDK